MVNMNRFGWRFALGSLLLCGLVATGARGQASDGQVEELLKEARGEYEELKLERDRLLVQLQESWRELDRPAPRLPDRTSRLALRLEQERTVREMEARLGAVLDRLHETRQTIRLLDAITAEDGAETGRGRLGGRWRFVFDGQPGSLDLYQTGALVSGGYSVDGMSRGTVFGFTTGRRVILTLVDNEAELFGTLRGNASLDDEIEGTFLRSDLASGRPAEGTWSAQKQ